MHTGSAHQVGLPLHQVFQYMCLRVCTCIYIYIYTPSRNVWISHIQAARVKRDLSQLKLKSYYAMREAEACLKTGWTSEQASEPAGSLVLIKDALKLPGACLLVCYCVFGVCVFACVHTHAYTAQFREPAISLVSLTNCLCIYIHAYIHICLSCRITSYIQHVF